jgi:predicted transcriptional regulator of viral defense system
MNYQGLNAERRKNLAHLLAAGKGAITIDFAAEILAWDREKARAFLSSLNRSGWLKLIKSGIYVPVPLESDERGLTDDDPFVLAPYLFGDCYIGGWSAVSFWGLTDQIFQKIWVVTSEFVRQKEETRADHTYLLRHVSKDYFFGLHSRWIKQDKIFISDPHKTVIDFANFIEGFGARNFVDIFTEYLQSEHKDLDLLLDYAGKSRNRTLYKRLGFMLEKYDPQAIKHINFCLRNVSKGPSKLSPNTPCEVYIKKWHLKVPRYMVSK